MKRFLNSIVEGVKKVVKGRKTAAQPRRSALGVEQLEQRELPTTLSALATAVAANVRHDAIKLVQDAVTIEVARPTLLVKQIGQDLQFVNNAAHYGSIDTVFGSEGRLLNDLLTELNLDSLLHLQRPSLLN